MLLNLHKFAFEGQNMNFTVNMLLTCILYCAREVDLIMDVIFSLTIKYTPYFLLARFSLGDAVGNYFEKTICLSRDILMFLAAI